MVLLPDSYRACAAAAPAPGASTPSASSGVPPVTMTSSSNSTVMAISSPGPYSRSAAPEYTDTTAGETPSTAMSRRSPSDIPEPGAGRVVSAAKRSAPASLTVPLPDRARMLV